ncbi:MAG: ABC transporter substrate-binding protein, partial [Phycisphaerae bacterium]|nr:ABC transporter substrate-binding protein [Phycisphaerae bacterium]
STKLSLAFIQDKILGLDDFRKKTKRYTPGDFSRYDKEELTGVAAVDEHTLQIRLKKRFPQFLYVLAMHVYAPIPREVIDYHLSSRPSGREGRVAIEMKERSTEIRNREAVVGTGPYVLTEWIRGGKIVLERNMDFRDDYYPSEGAPGDRQAGLLDDAGKKLPFVDVRYLTFVAEENPAWMLFLTKQRDVGGIPRDVFASVISPSRELTDRWRKRGIRLIKNPYPAIFWLAFNMEDPVVGSSRSLRQGLCLAFDVEGYIDVIYNGRGKRAVNTIPNTFKGHAEAGAGPYYRLDVNLAKKKIEEAKKELAAKGLLENGRIPQLTLDLPGRGEHYRRVAEFVQGEFRKVGIEIKVELNDWPTQQEKVHAKQCQIYAMGWHGDYPEAENFLQLYYGPNIGLGTNNTNYSNREFDRLFERAGTLAKIEDRAALYAKMAGMISQDCPVLLLSEPISFSLVYGWVHNFKPHPIGYGLSKYTRLDVKARRKAGGRE